MVRRAAKIFGATLAAFVVTLLAIGFALAGSTDRMAAGVTIAGVNVGGLSADQAEQKLVAKARSVSYVPVPFEAGGRRWPIAPAQLALRADWAAAVQRALDQGGGSVPLRGLQRVRLRLFGADLVPGASYEAKTLGQRLDSIARAVNVQGREAAIVLKNGQPLVVPGEAGRKLDRAVATRTIVAALVSFERKQVDLPVVVDRPKVTRDALRPVAAQVRMALSGPVGFVHKGVHWSVSPAQIATFLQLPQEGSRELGIGGPAAKRYFAALAKAVGRPPREVDFAVSDSGRARLIPSRDGRKLDVEATQTAFLAAALRATNRGAGLVVVPAHPQISTERAKSLGIIGMVGSYTTF